MAYIKNVPKKRKNFPKKVKNFPLDKKPFRLDNFRFFILLIYSARILRILIYKYEAFS